LERDIKILKKHNIMDYSLLLAVERNPNYKDISGIASKGPSSTTSDDN
jgi:hypothetical protein